MEENINGFGKNWNRFVKAESFPATKRSLQV